MKQLMSDDGFAGSNIGIKGVGMEVGKRECDKIHRVRMQWECGVKLRNTDISFLER